VGQEITRPSVHCIGHKSSLLVFILSQMNPDHILTHHSKIHINIILPFTHLYSNYFFPSGLLSKIISFVHATSQFPLFDHVNDDWRRIQVLKLVMQFSSSSRHLLYSGSKCCHHLLVLMYAECRISGSYVDEHRNCLMGCDTVVECYHSFRGTRCLIITVDEIKMEAASFYKTLVLFYHAIRRQISKTII
jgi:hypothetical protein